MATKDKTDRATSVARQLQIKLGGVPDINKNRANLDKVQQATAQIIHGAAQTLLATKHPQVVAAASTNPDIAKTANVAFTKLNQVNALYGQAAQAQEKLKKSTDEVDINFGIVQCAEAYVAASTQFQLEVLPAINAFTAIVLPIIKASESTHEPK